MPTDTRFSVNRTSTIFPRERWYNTLLSRRFPRKIHRLLFNGRFFSPPFWATLGYAHRGYQCRRNRSWNTLVYQDPFHRFQPWTINVIAYETDLIDAIRPNENGSACILAISRIWISIVYVWRCTSKLLARCYLES